MPTRYSALSVGAFEPATGRYQRSQLPMANDGSWISALWKFAGWLPDSRHFAASGRGQIALVDVETGAWQGLPSFRSAATAGRRSWSRNRSTATSGCSRSRMESEGVQSRPMPRSLPIRRVSLKDEGRTHDQPRLSPDEGIAMMWQLALQAWMFKEGMVDEPRLRRDVVRIVRGGR